VVAKFTFASKFFAKAGVEFVRTSDRRPILRFDLGDQKASFSLSDVIGAAEPPIKHEDMRLLYLIEPALQYVERVIPNAPVPTELTTGQPSWRYSKSAFYRSVRLVFSSLSVSVSDLAAPQDAADFLAGRAFGGDASRRRDFAERIQHVLEAIAFATDLNMDLIDGQRVLGEIATLANGKGNFSGKQQLREIALVLRPVFVWAVKQAMLLDTLVNDVTESVSNQDRVSSRIWPAINEQRAWSLDVMPVKKAWQVVSAGSDCPRVSDIEELLRLVTIRYSRFNPAIYQPNRGACRTTVEELSE